MLPFFSRLTLRRILKSLKLMNVKVAVNVINNVSEKKGGKIKHKKGKQIKEI
jgi:hypothetical protein